MRPGGATGSGGAAYMLPHRAGCLAALDEVSGQVWRAREGTLAEGLVGALSMAPRQRGEAPLIGHNLRLPAPSAHPASPRWAWAWLRGFGRPGRPLLVIDRVAWAVSSFGSSTVSADFFFATLSAPCVTT